MFPRVRRSPGWRHALALVASCLAIAMVAVIAPASAVPPAGNPATYTLNTHFDDGTLVNVNDTDVSDQLQLNSLATPFNFIWVAVSSKGTVVKIDTSTGTILGEYHSTPASHGFGDPSRTTVDNDGSVWVGNRQNVSNGFGTVVHIGLEENGQCEDRDGSGTIDTSTGQGDIGAWVDSSGTRGVATAADECIVHYTPVNSTGTRHISVDANNNVWVSGVSLPNFDLVKGGRYDVPFSGTIIRSETSVGYGGYGGLIDGSGVIWSASPMLRWDTALPLTGPNGGNWTGYGHPSYGLCIDSAGNVWNTALSGNEIRKFAPDGTLLGTFGHGNEFAQGCVVDANDQVWVAHSLLGPGGQTTVGHILNDGTYVGNVTVGSGPTGVAVDAAGKIWATNYFSQTASRIDPVAGPIGADLITLVGAVDLTTADLGGTPYNYSDMTGSTLIAPPTSGTWTVTHDSGQLDAPWSNVSWNSDLPVGSSITVTVASSDNAGGPFSVPETVTNGVDLATTPAGQFLKVVVRFERADGFDPSPALYDLTLAHNRAPDCSNATPSVDILWPPNHKFVDVNVLGVTDPDGDPITLTVDSIWQDEPTDTRGDGSFAPDGAGVGTNTASVRAERTGTPGVPGDGRAYHIAFTADDGNGGSCSGSVTVGVPHDENDVPVDGGPLFDSTF